MTTDHRRFHREHEHAESAFGGGGFGQFAEQLARFFGTPQYLGAQTASVIVWIAMNAAGVVRFESTRSSC